MKWLAFFSIFITKVFSHNIYQKHLPVEIYQPIIARQLLDENEMNTTTDLKYGDISDRIDISVQTNQGQYVLIGYEFGEVIDNVRGIQVGYQEGKMIGYAIFDQKGLDYVAYPPFSRRQEKKITLKVLDLIERRM